MQNLPDGNQPQRLRFGPFELDRAESCLLRNGSRVRLERQAFLVLLALTDRPNEIVSREELKTRIWGDGTNVSFQDGMNTAVRKLRSALGDSADVPLYIETVPRLGYRFVAPVIRVEQRQEADVIANEQLDDTQRTPTEAGSNGSESAEHTITLPSPEPRRGRRSVALIAACLGLLTAAALIFWHKRVPSRIETQASLAQAHKLPGVHTWLCVAISPSGQMVAYADRQGSRTSVRLHQISNGGDIEVLSSEDFVGGLTFSPDESDLFVVEGTSLYRSLYRMPVLGGPRQKLVEDIDSPVSFSPDGSHFTFSRFLPQESAIEVRVFSLSKLQDALLTKIDDAQYPCSFPPYPRWSPDGRRIAISYQKTTPKLQSLISVIDVATGRLTTPFSGHGCPGNVAWLSNDTLVFTDQGRLVKLENGLSSEMRYFGYDGKIAELLDLSHDRETAVATGNTASAGLWIVPLQLPNRPKALLSEETHLDQAGVADDGRLIITKDDRTVWSVPADAKDWQRIGEIRGRGMACGRDVLITTESNALVIFRSAALSGHTIVPEAINWVACSPKAEAVFYTRADHPQQVMQVLRNGSSSTPFATILNGTPRWLAYSGDATLLGCLSYDASADNKYYFTILRTKDGSLVKTIRLPDLGGISQFAWSSNAGAIDYISSNDHWADVWQVSLAGGRPKPLTSFRAGVIWDFNLSLDQKNILVVRTTNTGDVIVMTKLH